MTSKHGNDRREKNPAEFASHHASLTRRYFLQLGTAGAAALGASEIWAKQVGDQVLADPVLAAAVSELEYLTPAAKFKVQRRGKPTLTELPPEKLPSIGLTPETWKLEVLPDPESDSEMGNPLSKAKGNPLDWAGLMKLAEKHSVRFLHLLTCTNNPRPYGMGFWEGVPLREILWLTEPKQNIRRVVYRRLPQRRPQTGLPELPGDQPGPGGTAGRIAGHCLLQTERPVDFAGQRRAGAADRAGLLRQPFHQVAAARLAYQQLPGQRHLRPEEQRRGKPHQDLRAFHPHAGQRQSGTALCHHRPGAGRALRAEESPILAALPPRKNCPRAIRT